MTDQTNTPTTKQEEGGLGQSPTDEAFADAVWAALKGDHNDLRKQAIILRAHRAAAPATPPHNEDGLRKAFIEGAWAGWRSGLAGEQMDDAYARRSWDASDARQALGEVG